MANGKQKPQESESLALVPVFKSNLCTTVDLLRKDRPKIKIQCPQKRVIPGGCGGIYKEIPTGEFKNCST